MKRTLALILAALFALFALLAAAPAPALRVPVPMEPRFIAVDIHADPHGAPLASYQFELIARDPGVEIVGVEGGEHAAFKDAPFYDPAALAGDRIVIAAFSTRDAIDLPANPTRIARLHLRVEGPAIPTFRTRVAATTGPAGAPIDAAFSITEGTTP